MAQLPREIQQRILRFLTIQDKLTCSLVSKDWNKHITPYLFNRTVIQNDLKLSKALMYFEKYPEIDSTVLHLEIEDCRTALLYLPRIQKLFRNLKKINCFGHDAELQLRYPPESTSVFGGTWNNLTKLDTSEVCAQSNTTMAELILSNPCPRLTTLYMQPTYSRYDSNEILETRLASIFNLLHNAPQLSELKIEYFYGTLSFLENIHRNAPNLNRLRVTDLGVAEHIEPVEPPETVELADLWIEFYEPSEDALTSFYSYIAKKYTGLTSFKATLYDYDTYVSTNYSISTLQGLLSPLFANCPQLSSYNQRFFPLTPAILQEMDRCDIHLDEINLYVDQHTVESQCVALSESEQGRSVNHVILNLEDFDPQRNVSNPLVDAFIIPKALDSLANLNNLTSLTIESRNNNIVRYLWFPDFLNKIPTLSELTLEYDTILTATPYNLEIVLTTLSLKKIAIGNLQVLTNTDNQAVNSLLQKLLQSCPYLENFTLYISWALVVPCACLNSVTLDFSNNLELKSVFLSGGTNRFCIVRNNPFMHTHYLYDNARRLLMESNDFVSSNKNHSITLASQPVLLNHYRV